MRVGPVLFNIARKNGPFTDLFDDFTLKHDGSPWQRSSPEAGHQHLQAAEAPSGQDFFKQSTTRLYFIAEKIVEMTVEMYRTPKKMVEETRDETTDGISWNKFWVIGDSAMFDSQLELMG